jgi:excisionase family DNA binding protein
MYLTVKDLATQLRVKPSTLYAWAAQGKIPSLRIHGLVRFNEADINRWLESFRPSVARSSVPRFQRANRRDLDGLIARARRAVYSSRDGETRPTSSLIRKEEADGAV